MLYLARKEVGGKLRVYPVRPSPPPPPDGTGPKYSANGVRLGRRPLPPTEPVLAYGGTFYGSPSLAAHGRSPSRASLAAAGWYGVGRSITEAIQQLAQARDENPNI